MLPDSAEGPVLPLLPVVDCRFNIKPVLLFKHLATEVSPLSLILFSQNPPLLPSDSFQTPLQHQQPLFLPSPPICTLPPPMHHGITDMLPFPPDRNPVAVVPLQSPHCARLKISSKIALQHAPDTFLQSSDLNIHAATSCAQNLLQLLSPSEKGKEGLPDLNTTPIYVLDHNKSDNVQVYVRRSQRIQKAYDGERVSTVEWASR